MILPGERKPALRGRNLAEGFRQCWLHLTILPRLWVEHAHPERGTVALEDWAHFIGATMGQFLLTASFSRPWCSTEEGTMSRVLFCWIGAGG